METLADLVARDRRSDDPALRTPSVESDESDGTDRELDYRRFCTTAWKAGNFLRHLGVGPGHTVAVAADPAPPPVLTFLGAAMLGAETVVTADPATVEDPRAVLIRADREAEVAVAPGTALAVYGGEPSEATTDHWEGGVWSENPAFPPTTATGETTALAPVGGAEWSHGDLLSTGRTVVSALDLAADETVEVRAPLADPRAVAAGLVAPLLAGGCARLTATDEGLVRVAGRELSLSALEE